MIARELTEFFAGFAPNGRPVAQRLGDAAFLSNVNACYRRALLGRDPLRRRGLRRGPGLRAAMLEQGWTKVYHPAPPSTTRTTTARWSSCAATSTNTADCVRRSATWSRSRRVAWLERSAASCRATGPGCASEATTPAPVPAGACGRPRTTRAEACFCARIARGAPAGPVAARLLAGAPGRYASRPPPRTGAGQAALGVGGALGARRPGAPADGRPPGCRARATAHRAGDPSVRAAAAVATTRSSR